MHISILLQSKLKNWLQTIEMPLVVNLHVERGYSQTQEHKVHFLCVFFFITCSDYKMHMGIENLESYIEKIRTHVHPQCPTANNHI